MLKEARHSVRDRVFFWHPVHAWVIGRIESVTENTTAKVGSWAKAREQVFSSKKKLKASEEVSKYVYNISIEDDNLNVKGVVANVAEANIEICENSDSISCSDLLNLIHLHDATILRTLMLRYYSNVIYTNIGVIVVALNPFNTEIPHYQDSEMKHYLAEIGSMTSERRLPHTWAMAHNTFHELTLSRESQSVLISGESGSGKTEATKIVMKYLAQLSSLKSKASDQEDAGDIGRRLLSCSPVLESFGNARTVKNDNSSRFGKLLTVKFDCKSFVILGAHTTKYLLEKSRVITCAKHERLYHSFYLAARGSMAKLLGFEKKIEDYPPLVCGQCTDNSEFSTAADFETVCFAMSHIGINKKDIQSVWSIAAGVTHLSCVEFENSEGVGCEGARMKSGHNKNLECACRLWEISQDALAKQLITVTLKLGQETIDQPLPPYKAKDVRDATSKGIYDRLFQWLVNACNSLCDVEAPSAAWIALLDIFGFENFEHNSFEQLCINFANETLQHHYNQCVFDRDMLLCRGEGIEVSEFVAPTLSGTIDTIARIFFVLDDARSMGEGSVESFLGAVLQEKKKKDLVGFEKQFEKDEFFIVSHFAGQVKYDATGWIEKNRDSFQFGIKKLMALSTNSVCASIFGPEVEAGDTRRDSVAGYFKKQLSELMTVINSTNPHWIRCIKPHPAKQKMMFGNMYTFEQLRNCGILDTVKVRKEGYPIRWPHRKFCVEYAPIVGFIATDNFSLHASTILKNCSLSEKRMTQIGKTLVFVKSEAFYILEKYRKHASWQLVIRIQKAGRGLRARRRLFNTSKALVFQRFGRRYLQNTALFQLFCEVNRERLLEERLQKQLERERLEEEKKERARALRQLEVQKETQRNCLVQEEEESRNALLDDVNLSQDELDKLAKRINLQRLFELTSLHAMQEVKRLEEQLDEGTKKIYFAQEEVHLKLQKMEWTHRLDVTTFENLQNLIHVERTERDTYKQELLSLMHIHEEAFGKVQNHLHLWRERQVAEQFLADRRQQRKAKEAARHERLQSLSRSRMEVTLIDKVTSQIGPQLSPPSETSRSPSPLDIRITSFSPSPSRPSVDLTKLAASMKQVEMTKRVRAVEVELGQVVFVSRVGLRGVVVEKTDFRVGGPVAVAFSSSEQPVWFEITELELLGEDEDYFQQRTASHKASSFSRERSSAKPKSDAFLSWQALQHLYETLDL